MTSRVSVIIPTHNRPEQVVEAVQSVLNQTFTDLELIVVDVGLERRAKNALQRFAHDSRFRYVENSTEIPGGAARNIGARLASGKYIAFLDDDDQWMPEKLSIQLEKFDHLGADVGFCFSAVVNDFGKGKEVVSNVYDGVMDFSELAFARMKGFLTVTLVIKKEVFDSVGGFDELLPSHQDPELIIRIAQKWKGLGINRPLVKVNMRQDNDNGGKNIEKKIRGREMVIAKHIDEFTKRPTVLARHYFWLGIWYRDNGDVPAARNYFFKAFRLSRKFRYLFHYIFSPLSSLVRGPQVVHKA